MKKIIKVLLMVVLLCLITGCENKDKVGKVNGQKIIDDIAEVLASIKDTTNDEDIAIESSSENTEGNTNDSSTASDSEQSKDSKATSNEVATNSTNNNTTEIPAQTKKQVTITIECKTILNSMDKLKAGYEGYVPSDGIVLKSTTVEIKDGTTVLEVLQQVCSNNGIDLKNQGGYIQGIKNIDAFCCGEASGWMYSINDKYVNKGANKREVVDGERIKWLFSCSNGKDLNLQ